MGDLCDKGVDFDGDGIIDTEDRCPKFSDASQNSKSNNQVYLQ